MSRRIVILIATVLSAAAIACHHQRPVVWAPDAVATQTIPLQGDDRTVFNIDVPSLMAVGDTASIALRQLRCHGDFCSASRIGLVSAEVTVTSDPPDILESTDGGGLIARRVGVATLNVSHETIMLARRLRVVPPVATLKWEPENLRIHVGDTVRACAVARDARGRMVGIVQPNYSAIGLGLAILSIVNEHDPCRWVANGESGNIVLTASLGPRVARLPVTIIPR